MRIRTLVFAVAIAGAGLSPALAKDLRLADGYPAASQGHAAVLAFIDYVQKNSDIKIEDFNSGSLLTFTETSPGIRDGLVDLATVLTPYYPADFPEPNLVANLSMLVTTGKKVVAPGAVAAGVKMEYLFNCANCQATYARQNQVYLGSPSTTEFDLMCRMPIRSAEELKGKRIRTGAGNFGRFAEHFGATQVSLPAQEMYDALAQGVVDCSTHSMADLTGMRLADVVKYAIRGIPGGTYLGIDSYNINKSVWQGLTDDERRVMLEAAARGSAAATAKWYRDAITNTEGSAQLGVEIIPATEEMLKSANEFVAKDVSGAIAAEFTEKYGLSGVPAEIEKITALVDKWKGLVGEWSGDEEALANIYWTEILSKVDPAKYGMN